MRNSLYLKNLRKKIEMIFKVFLIKIFLINIIIKLNSSDWKSFLEILIKLKQF